MMNALVASLLLALQQPPPPPPKPEPPKVVVTPEAAKTDLALSIVLDKPSYVIGEEIQAEVTLTNGTEKDVELAELVFEERSLSFDVLFEVGGGKPQKQFSFALTRPDPHLADRLGLPRVSLKSKKSVTGLYRIPTLKTGGVSVTAKYKGSDKEVRSAPAVAKVDPQADGGNRLAAILETSQGKIQIDLAPEEAPNTVASFVSLARRDFYSNMLFFRVIKDNWIQTGCPYDNGYGGPGYTIRSEAKDQTGTHEPGTVVMSGHMKTENSGSQFFVELASIPSFGKKFTILGKTSGDGLEVAKKIGKVETDKSTDKPKEDVVLKSVTIVVVK